MKVYHLQNKLLFVVLAILIAVLVYVLLTADRVAGGIVYSIENGMTKYLLVTTTSGKKWIFPKGKVKAYEFNEQAAVREVVEEAGVEVKVAYKLDGAPYLHKKKSGKEQIIELYAMKYLGDAPNWKEQDNRSRMWMSYSMATSVLSNEFIRALDEVHNKLNE